MILSIPVAVKVAGITSWVYHTQVKEVKATHAAK